MALPNLFVAGAPKCGTTSLHNYLSQHPDIHMSRIKEPRFYVLDGKRPQWCGPGDEWANDNVVFDRGDYEALFADGARSPYRGESSPYYLWSPDAATRILEDTPDARFIIVLREPVERAHSAWGHLWSQGREPYPSLTEAIQHDDERRQRGWEPFWLYRELGLYGEQMQRLLAVVPNDQLKVVYYDDYMAGTETVVSGIFAWLGVDDRIPVDVTTRHNSTVHIPKTARNRLLHSLVSRKSPVKRVIPSALRRRVAGAVLRTIRSSASSTATDPVPVELRELFRDDLALLHRLRGDVPNAWLQAIPTAAPASERTADRS